MTNILYAQPAAAYDLFTIIQLAVADFKPSTTVINTLLPYSKSSMTIFEQPVFVSNISPSHVLNISMNDYNCITNSKTGDINLEETKMKRNLNKLDAFYHLSDNWNGNGAAPLPSCIIENMKDIIMSLKHQPDIFPTACDSIQFEYEKGSGEYLEFELSENNTLKVFEIDKLGNENQYFIKPDALNINEVVNKFYEQ